MLSLYGTRTKINPNFDATVGDDCPEDNNCSTMTVQKVKLLQPDEVIASRLVHHDHHHDHRHSLERYIHKISNALHVYYSKEYRYSAPLTPGSRSLVVAIHPTGHCKVWLSTPDKHHHDSHDDKHYSNKEKVDDDLYEAEKQCVKSIESRIRPPHVQGGPIIFALIYSLIVGGVSVEHNTQEDGQFRTPPEWIDVIMNSDSLPTPDEIVSQLW
mmetsp:Transcript_24385/g.44099  ORF Transcript_24385/g.44099 Transcript_24385/m.44099 type:complete len:213 (-) Transcript_24385:55-693(-)